MPEYVVKKNSEAKKFYARQKNQAYAYFRVRSDELSKIENAQFTIYDFINNSFSFSQTKKELTIKVLEVLKIKPSTFKELVVSLNAKKSTLYLLCLSLERSGLIQRKSRNQPFHLSNAFSTMLRKYAEWWEKWVKAA